MYYPSDKYKSFQLIQYLLTITNEQFREEFKIINEEDVDMLVTLLDNIIADNLNKLQMMVSIAKHVECSPIYLQFSDNFKLDDISDDVIINMLDNVENKL